MKLQRAITTYSKIDPTACATEQSKAALINLITDMRADILTLFHENQQLRKAVNLSPKPSATEVYSK